MAGSAEIKASPEELHATAVRLRGVIGEIDAQILEVRGLRAITAQEASYGTVDTAPAPYYAPLLEALRGATGSVIKQLEQLKANVEADATALDELATRTVEAEQNSAARITAIGTPRVS